MQGATDLAEPDAPVKPMINLNHMVDVRQVKRHNMFGAGQNLSDRCTPDAQIQFMETDGTSKVAAASAVLRRAGPRGNSRAALMRTHRVAVEGAACLVIQADAQLELKGAAIIGGVHGQVTDAQNAQAVACRRVIRWCD